VVLYGSWRYRAFLLGDVALIDMCSSVVVVGVLHNGFVYRAWLRKTERGKCWRQRGEHSFDS